MKRLLYSPYKKSRKSQLRRLQSIQDIIHEVTSLSTKNVIIPETQPLPVTPTKSTNTYAAITMKQPPPQQPTIQQAQTSTTFRDRQNQVAATTIRVKLDPHPPNTTRQTIYAAIYHHLHADDMTQEDPDMRPDQEIEAIIRTNTPAVYNVRLTNSTIRNTLINKGNF